jgi:methylenetetrahydrofolate reductase (NADPH)
MKIIDKINKNIEEDKLFYSFEFFPPKTENAIENIYARFDSMSDLQPLFIDITWGAGGSTSGLTIEIASSAQNLFGMESQIHMTCTNIKKEELKGKFPFFTFSRENFGSKEIRYQKYFVLKR